MKERWTGETDLKDKLSKKWEAILASAITGADTFSLTIKLAMPSKEVWPDCWDQMIAWVDTIHRGGQGGQCYRVIEKSVRHAVLGNNVLPTHVMFENGEQACRYLGRWTLYQQFKKTVTVLTTPWPQLRPWAVKYPSKVAQLEPKLHAYLNVLHWFFTHQPQGQYLRELSIPEVDTKFVEQNKTLIGEMLEYILPTERMNPLGKDFESRYMLEKKADMVRFRILDDNQRLANLSDFTVPIDQFCHCHLPQDTFFIVENELSFLTFPKFENGCVIFGKGYGVDVLRNVGWLQNKTIYYWGDLDTHGFQILSNARSLFPHIISMLMEEETLLSHQSYWVREETQTLSPPTHLSDAEYALCCHLQSGRWGNQIRLEQERIEKTLVEKRLHLISRHPQKT